MSSNLNTSKLHSQSSMPDSFNEKNKKFLILFNPSSGKGKALQKKQDLLNLLQEENLSYDFYQTLSEQDLRQKVEQATRYKCLVAAGGDSTFAIVVEEMLRLGIKMPVAIVPVGTSDDIARQWGIVSTKDAVQALAKYHLQFVDLIELSRFNLQIQKQESFAHIAGQVNIGLGALVNRSVAKFYKYGFLNKIPESIVGFFVILYLTAFGRLALPLKISVQDKSGKQTKEMHCSAVLFTSIKYWVKGLHFSPDSLCDDGNIEAVIVKKAGFFSILKLFLASRNGEHLHLPFVEYWRGLQFEVESTNGSKFFLQADGEILRTTDKAELSLNKFRLHVHKRSLQTVTGNPKLS